MLLLNIRVWSRYVRIKSAYFFCGQTRTKFSLPVLTVYTRYAVCKTTELFKRKKISVEQSLRATDVQNRTKKYNRIKNVQKVYCLHPPLVGNSYANWKNTSLETLKARQIFSCKESVTGNVKF